MAPRCDAKIGKVIFARALTVAITYHDERELLGRALRSFITPDSRPSEILIHDDASKHPPESHVPIELRNNVSILRSNETIGPARSRNRLLGRARSEFIHFHDSDDWVEQGWQNRVMSVFERSATDVVFTGVKSFRHGKLFSGDVMPLADLIESSDLLGFAITNFMLVPSGTFRTDFLRKLGGYDEKLWQSEDYDLHIRVALSGPRFEVIPDPLVSIDIRDDSRSQKKNETYPDAVKSLSRLLQHIPSSHHKIVSKRLVQLGGILWADNDRVHANEAFKVAHELGLPSLPQRLMGPARIEAIKSIYRRLLPAAARSFLKPITKRTH